MTGRRRVVSGLALILAYPVLLRVPFAQLPAAIAVVGIEALVIGTVPFGIAFLAQTLLGHKRLGDPVLMLLAVAAVAVWWYLGLGAAESPVEGAVMLFMSVLLLLWFLSLGAASARMLNKQRLSKASSGPRVAQQAYRADAASGYPDESA